jgi:hypothetical protein
MALQRTLGNRAVGALLGRQPIQAKLIVNAPPIDTSAKPTGLPSK